jgi:transposase
MITHIDSGTGFGGRSDLRRIGEEITERGHIVPARVVVRRYVRPKYGCPDGHAVKTAALPDGVIDGGKYEASVYAHVVSSKYSDHVPLNRLEGMLKRRGVHLPKQTMWDMLVRVDELVAQPVLAAARATPGTGAACAVRGHPRRWWNSGPAAAGTGRWPSWGTGPGR